MANGFDRLERFFAKRKASAASGSDAIQPIITTGPVTEPQFPSPSFIRPKTTRMAAREEVIVKQPSSTRSPSVADGSSPNQMGSINAQNSTCSSDSYRLQYSPVRTSLVRQRQAQLLIDGFGDYEFPRPPTHTGESSPVSSTSSPTSSFELPDHRSPRSRSPRKSRCGLERLDTPVSDPEDDDLRCPRYFQNKKLPDLPHGALPTPGPSPELLPVLDSQLSESQSIEVLNREVYQDIRRKFDESLKYPSLQRASGQSSLSQSPSRESLSSSTLRMPNFNDFLSLSDDDIAEISPEGPDHVLEPEPSTPSTLAPAISSPQDQLLLTLTPPYASPPATAAAFEAARIASRYNFDLVYVVNLWPDVSGPATSGPGEDSASFDHSAKSPTKMTGRLLAAYGLHNVKSPFQISSEIHGKILRSNGWIEYRNHEARDDEFARGFACAFYTGQYSKNGSFLSGGAPSPIKTRQNNRGIVFAAYRKPRVDGSMLGVGSSKSELADVHQDAEALVEMLIDIHVASRLRQPLPQSQDFETGPMPMQAVELS
ncbi:hypothetical protein AK830_g1049 [Neonectria ditissima]|uniref:Uncharacterized protein n=1 Tax=Neonectria ditissima TaxID=78410 RepID=A0A0P7BV18_9HYPO|nr:hypothetical protein AK830_g1049 [Neonectria ditissima]